MFREIYKLVIYRSFHQDQIFHELANTIINIENDTFDQYESINTINQQLNHLLTLATSYGFNDNLWQNYLTYLLIGLSFSSSNGAFINS